MRRFPFNLKHPLQRYLVQAFPGITSRHIRKIQHLLEEVNVLSGTVLLHEGEQSDNIYIVITGSFICTSRSESGQQRLLGQIGAGELFGELGFFHQAKRTATITATRDSRLIKIPNEAFEYIFTALPQISKRLIDTIIARSHDAPKPHQTPMTSVAFIAYDNKPKLIDFIEKLRRAFVEKTRLLILTRDNLNDYLWSGAADTAHSDVNHNKITEWLNQQEMENDLIIYLATLAETAWLHRCIRQVDRIIVVMQPNQKHRVAAFQAAFGSPSWHKVIAPKELVVLHENSQQRPENTHYCAPPETYVKVHHLRTFASEDYARFMRHLTGNSRALVLSGGSARGFAHIGVIRALEEANFPIDLVAGNSMGAVIASQYAAGFTPEEIHQRTKDGFLSQKPYYDYTVPFVALLSGTRFKKLIEDLVGDLYIEDLWLNFFCVSSNLSTSHLTLHQTGLLKLALLASTALPAINPPVVNESGELLVDGAILNNLPVDIMRNLGVKHIVASNLSDARIAGKHFIHENFSGWQILRKRLNVFSEKTDIPTLFEIISRSMLLSSQKHSREMAKLCDLYIDPPVGQFGLFEWSAIDKIVKVGYEYAIKLLEKQPP